VARSRSEAHSALLLSLLVFSSACGGQQGKAPAPSKGGKRALVLQEDCPGGGKRSGYWPTNVVGDGTLLWSGCVEEKDGKRARVGKWLLKDDGGRDRGFVTFEGGKLEGRHELRSNGGATVVLKGTYAAGERAGTWYWFHPGGKLARHVTFEQGWQKAELACPAGSLPTSDEVEGEQAQPSERWCADAEGRRQGPHLRWHENGLLAQQMQFKDDVAHGPFERFNEWGRESMSGAMKDGEFDGLVATWYESGVLASWIAYDRGEYAGKRDEWDERGALTLSIEYKDGQPQKARLTCEDWLAKAAQFARSAYYYSQYSLEYAPVDAPERPEEPPPPEEAEPEAVHPGPLGILQDYEDPVFLLGFDVSVATEEDGTPYLLLKGKEGTQLAKGSWKAKNGDLEPVSPACRPIKEVP